MKRIISILLALTAGLAFTTAHAQDIWSAVIKQNDGQITKIPVTDIAKISFIDMSKYEHKTDYAIDFTDMTAADAADFTTPQFTEGTTYPFTPAGLQILFGADIWGFASTCFDVELLFTQGQGSVLGQADNLLVYKADFSNKLFPELRMQVLNLAALFGPEFAPFSARFGVAISTTPITDANSYYTSTFVGQGEFPTDPSAEDHMIKDFTFSIPPQFNGECYIAISNCSYFDSPSGGDLGLVILDYQLSSFHQK